MKLIIPLLLAPFVCMAGLNYPSDRLKVMDIETLQRIVNKNLNSAQRALHQGQMPEVDGDFSASNEDQDYTKEDGHSLIKQSLELVFAKPEQNHATSVVYSNVEGVAIEYGGVLSYLEEITSDALNILDKSGNETALIRDQNTYIYILNNMMGEIKPLVATKEGAAYKKLIEKIRDADIDFSDSLKSYRVLNSMSNITNPSKLAATIVGEKECAWWEFLWCWH